MTCGADCSGDNSSASLCLFPVIPVNYIKFYFTTLSCEPCAISVNSTCLHLKNNKIYSCLLGETSCANGELDTNTTHPSILHPPLHPLWVHSVSALVSLNLLSFESRAEMLRSLRSSLSVCMCKQCRWPITGNAGTNCQSRPCVGSSASSVSQKKYSHTLKIRHYQQRVTERGQTINLGCK